MFMNHLLLTSFSWIHMLNFLKLSFLLTRKNIYGLQAGKEREKIGINIIPPEEMPPSLFLPMA